MSTRRDVVIREAKLEDASEIARIYNYYVREGGVTFDIDPWPAERISPLLERKADAWFVASDGTKLLGWASARQFSDRFGYRHSCETAIYMDNEACGTGAASLLQECIHAYCHGAKIHHAVAKIVADNQRSLAFHKRFGYELVGIQKEIGQVGDRWVDIVILQRIFEDEGDSKAI